PVRLAAENEKLVAHNFKLANARPLELTSEQIKALAVFFRYLGEVAPKAEFLFSIHREQLKSAFMKLDESAIKTLELFQDQSGSNKGSLLRVVNQTETTSGLRLLRDWLQRPLLDIEQIEQRYNIVESFLQEPGFRSEIKKILSGMGDIERILQNLGNTPKVRHLGSIRDSLANIGILIKKFNDHQGMHHLQQKWKSEDFLASLHSELEEALLNEELPPVLDERRFLKPGYSSTLDDFLKMTESAANVIQEFEQKEKEKTGITTLKVRYNRVVGYFIEVSKGQLEKVPPEYKRRQTLVNGERYESEELKQLEENILSARENVIRLQSAIFEDLCGKVLAEYSLLMSWARKIAELDVLVCFALVAEQKRYIRPLLVENGQMDIKNARHPVVESLFRDEIFVPNDVELNNTDRHLILLTGPNMAGKSTYIRQIGLLQIMAQAGCFVPAESAVLPLTDRIFTRIGAYDRLHKGESTFYVEMSECARIFQHFTEHSLILLDEVGRGTSTFDGISIARAMIEFLNTADGKKPRTLFATHYSELSELIEPGRGIIGMTVEVLEKDGKVIFLRKIREGVANRSYGIQVAQMAGLPETIVERAKMLLHELEDEGIWKKEPAFTVGRNGKNKSTAQNSEQIDLFGDQ
ncbi:MAG: DNA mismatch repair protein MutS, partial [Leptospiraceae bacterium]|nr:DNA mismatch repair protein MutS [Leptospiraceae bacterium]